jgi:hypothetical protein
MIKKHKSPSTKLERDIITGMIVSSSFLSKVEGLYSRFPVSPFGVVFTRTVAEWCLEYFISHNSAPGKHIQDIFEAKKGVIHDDSKIELVQKFLENLSEEYENKESFNEGYLFKQTDEYFRLKHANYTNSNLTEAISRGDVKSAEAILSDFKIISRPEAVGINPLTDKEFITEAFNESSGDALFTFPGEAGKVIGKFKRTHLIAFVGKQGAGKSWWLQDTAVQALNNGLNVLFVSTEMSEKEMLIRLHMNLSALPEYDGEVLFPEFDCYKNQEDMCRKGGRTCSVGILTEGAKPVWTTRLFRGKDRIVFDPPVPDGYVPCTFCRGRVDFIPASFLRIESRNGLTPHRAIRKGLSLTRTKLKGKEIKFIQFPSGMFTMDDLYRYLDMLEANEGFIPDVIITDYADKFRARNTNQQHRHQINEIWSEHKGLAQERNCAVVTASQTNVARSKGRDIGEADYDEDIRKRGHLNKSIALNQNPWEKKNGIMRISCIKERAARYSVLEQAFVLQCLDIGIPAVDSCRILGRRELQENDENIF